MLLVTVRHVAVFVSIICASGCMSAGKSGSQVEAAALPAAKPVTVDWQEVLHTDMVRLEDAGNQFLEAAFNLYDLLLDDMPGTDGINASLKVAASRYDDLAKMASELNRHLDDPAIKAELPLSHSQGEAEYATLRELLAKFPERKGPVPDYTLDGKIRVSQLVFGQRHEGPQSELRDIPAAHRDALELLDLLRAASSQLAQASLTVTDWVDIATVANPAMTHH